MDVTQLWSKFNYETAPFDDALITIRARDDANAVEGTTGFFRYPDILKALMTYLDKTEFDRDPSILIAPSSVGCEAYSLAMAADRHGLFKKYPDMKIYALDLRHEFLAAGASGVFPGLFRPGLAVDHRQYFKDAHMRHQDFIRLRDDIRDRVHFLPAQEIGEHAAARPYDVVMCLNLVRHLHRDPIELQAVLESLFSQARLSCINNAGYIDPGTLRTSFGRVSSKDVFAPLSAGMLPLKPVSKDASHWKLGRFHRDIGESTMFVYRHNL